MKESEKKEGMKIAIGRMLLRSDADDARCAVCGLPATETHHVFPGTARRKKSDMMGLTVRLCHACHMRMHDNASGKLRELQERAQRSWESQPGHSREAWISIMGKSWMK